ncbi:DUF6734 family protein [Kordia sp.]|uniref:DUF6734 family protein n=1 Tax=Kordia sp. TaxID=1965332 RepID=UPI003D2E4A38
MKIIHSLWSKPMLTPDGTLGETGWRHSHYFYMSWALSCLTFKEIYKDITLVTDDFGYDLLINKLKLPYTNIEVVLDELNHYPKELWAIGKLKAYQIQKEPFIHVDGDVYVWNSFGNVIENATLVSQQRDEDFGHYSHAMQEALHHGYEFPDFLLKEFLNKQTMVSSNAGIIGGNDLKFIQEYCKMSFEIIDKNIDKPRFNGTSYALLYEQYLFHCLAQKHQKQIAYYLENKPDKSEESHTFFNKYIQEKKFVHLLSMRKNEMEYCYDLRDQLKTNYPSYYEIIQNLA